MVLTVLVLDMNYYAHGIYYCTCCATADYVLCSLEGTQISSNFSVLLESREFIATELLLCLLSSFNSIVLQWFEVGIFGDME